MQRDVRDYDLVHSGTYAATDVVPGRTRNWAMRIWTA